MKSLSPEVQAAMIKVCADWAKHLDNFKPSQRKAALKRLLNRYEFTYETLQKIHGT
jgi:hypothetical protein